MSWRQDWLWLSPQLGLCPPCGQGAFPWVSWEWARGSDCFPWVAQRGLCPLPRLFCPFWGGDKGTISLSILSVLCLPAAPVSPLGPQSHERRSQQEQSLAQLPQGLCPGSPTRLCCPHSVLQAEPSQIPDPRHVWSRHSLPITDLCCGFGGPLARAATASLDQTAKVRLISEVPDPAGVKAR